jgi:hypothetical protein
VAVRAVTLRYRLGVISRCAAALAGGYGVAALLAIALAWTLPMARIDAATTGTIAALLALPAAAMGCFWARSAARAWLGITLFATVFGGIAFVAGWRP